MVIRLSHPPPVASWANNMPLGPTSEKGASTGPLGFNCVATGSDANDDPLNASPSTPIGTFELMNSKPWNGSDDDSRRGKSCVANLESCCSPPTVIFRIPKRPPLWSRRVNAIPAGPPLGLTMATAVLTAELLLKLTTMLVKVTSGLDRTLDCTRFPLRLVLSNSETTNPDPPP